MAEYARDRVAGCKRDRAWNSGKDTEGRQDGKRTECGRVQRGRSVAGCQEDCVLQSVIGTEYTNANPYAHQNWPRLPKK